MACGWYRSWFWKFMLSSLIFFQILQTPGTFFVQVGRVSPIPFHREGSHSKALALYRDTISIPFPYTHPLPCLWSCMGNKILGPGISACNWARYLRNCPSVGLTSQALSFLFASGSWRFPLILSRLDR